MPYDYTLDRARRCLAIIAADPVTLTDVLAQLERQAADGGWSGRLPNVRTKATAVYVPNHGPRETSRVKPRRGRGRTLVVSVERPTE
jgi:hypothetical protein